MLIYKDLGLIDYKKCWQLQEQLFNEMATAVQPGSEQYFLLCEHPHVYTLGKSGKRSNLLIDKELLAGLNAVYVHTNRGGDITYHGPGQLVGYPILNLNYHKMGVKKYVHSLEELIICVLKKYGIDGHRDPKAPGIWLIQQKKINKICALGIRVSHGITMHGFALNVNTDLKYYQYINPCGFTERGATSIQQITGKETDMNEIKKMVMVEAGKLFSS
jgi:lipoyl(octanoyl) transferase